MLVRLLVIVSLALLLFITFAGSPLALHTQSSALLVDCSLPMGLELPVGQGVEVRCHLQGESEATVEFVVNGRLQETEPVMPNGVMSLSWVPTNSGLHTFEVVAWVKGREAARVVRTVLVVPPGSPVCIR